MSDEVTKSRSDNELLREFLAGREVRCPMCRYSLRDLATGVCPECGSEIVLQVRPAEPRMTLWICGLVGWACGAGFFLSVVAYVTSTGWAFMNSRETAVTISALSASVAGLGVWIWQAHAVRRLGRTRRLVVSGSGWIMSIALVTIFFKVVVP